MVNITKLFLFNLGLLLLAGNLLAGCTKSGSMLFYQQGCISCHRFQDEGGMLGPDLTAVGQRRSSAWMDRYMQNPALTNPAARMPAFPHLSKSERQAIIEFLNE